jgi:large subunit ribosomal protein L23
MVAPKPQDYDVIISPIITEKATRILENNQVVFKVAPKATKPQIKIAVEALFGVKVVGINTVNIKGKNKVFKGIKGKRDKGKKGLY